MDTKLITEVTDWLKTTDLAEFCYEKDGDCIEVKTSEALPEPAHFACSLTAVTSPAIVQTVSQKHVITSPVSGKLRVVTAQEGAPVEYGLPLFFIEK